MPVLTFVVYLAVNWWATWYPGAEPGGGGYIAQRILSAKDERHSVLATLWFNIAHYAVRPWPWILVALCSLILYPDLADKEAGFIRVVIDPEVFPVALRGLIIAAFAAAYMSTITTQLNWGASYIINDFYRRFLARHQSEKHYVVASQAATFVVMVASCIVAYYFNTIEGAWKFLIAISAGTGSVFLLRWFWWRINAWSEVSAMIASFVISLVLQFYFGLDSDDPIGFAWILFHIFLGPCHLPYGARERGCPDKLLPQNPPGRHHVGPHCAESIGCAASQRYGMEPSGLVLRVRPGLLDPVWSGKDPFQAMERGRLVSFAGRGFRNCHLQGSQSKGLEECHGMTGMRHIHEDAGFNGPFRKIYSI